MTVRPSATAFLPTHIPSAILFESNPSNHLAPRHRPSRSARPHAATWNPPGLNSNSRVGIIFPASLLQFLSL